ncbi:MAG: DUF559 domain-containing protein [Planctomycetota bacterium]
MARQRLYQTETARRLRRDMTGPERALWNAVRSGRLAGLKVRRQVPIGRHVVDFLVASERLVIELDGISHDGRGVQDRRRQQALETAGYRVLRVANDDVLTDIETVLHAILRAAGRDIPQ